MAAGEYVSVSTQRDTEKRCWTGSGASWPKPPRRNSTSWPACTRPRASTGPGRQVAEQLTAKDALRAHAEAELGLDPDDLTNPWHAAGASFLAFLVGAAIPLLGVVIAPAAWITVGAVAIALAVTGSVSARLVRRRPARGGAQRCRRPAGDGRDLPARDGGRGLSWADRRAEGLACPVHQA